MDYYRSHWVNVDSKRLKTYDEAFKWSPMLEPLLQGLSLEGADLVVDYGCGPGHVTLEMAHRMKPDARVLGCDINQEMLVLAGEHALDAGLAERVSWSHTTSDKVPLEDGSADLVFCKNTLLYLELDDALQEFKRILKPGGTARLVDVDWDMAALEPIGWERYGDLLDAARHAFKDTRTARRMYGAARRAGFGEVSVSVTSVADTLGFFIPLSLDNLVTYALDGGYPREKGERFLEDTRKALERKEYLMVVPVFVVTAGVPPASD